LDATGISKTLIIGDTYQFRVTARNVVGDSAKSSILSAMAATVPG
jgi:hypothetical protein